jgi:hypothetical protein
MAYLLMGYFSLWVPYFFWMGYLDSPFGFIAAFPVLSVYIFHNIGIPDLIQHNGACGWGWCAPTIFGWVFIILFWLIVLWILAWFINKLTNNSDKTHFN